MAEGEEKGLLLLNGHGISVWEGEKVLEMDDRGDGCATIRLYLTTQNHTLKNGKFYVTYAYYD